MRRRGKWLPQTKLTGQDVSATREKNQPDAASLSALGTKYGTSSQNMCGIIQRTRWSRLDNGTEGTA